MTLISQLLFQNFERIMCVICNYEQYETIWLYQPKLSMQLYCSKEGQTSYTHTKMKFNFLTTHHGFGLHCLEVYAIHGFSVVLKFYKTRVSLSRIFFKKSKFKGKESQ